jgi:hypothetical protein
MIVYEVTALVAAGLSGDFETYMRGEHIREVLATGYFTGASLFRASENHYCIRYEARSEKDLDHYLAHQAPRLRGDFLIHFPEGVEVSRAIWKEVERFQPQAGSNMLRR